jgi:hypothetical protein
MAGWRRRLLFAVCNLPKAPPSGLGLPRTDDSRSLREAAALTGRGLRQPSL